MEPIPPLEIKIRRALFDMGILPTRKGYHYLLAAVSAVRAGEAPDQHLYREIARAHGIKESSVRSAILHVLEHARRIDAPLYRRIINPSTAATPRPSEFICRMAAWLEEQETADAT